ncbi:Sialidase [Pseudomassariella vexata]|uniref:Sialidase n=1 Tax=Pseudomassariella vexata TaxID=1141098 RepID=A0A1Y2DR86_9PEZI|nr:Sialidase [Pseudomassariella vexata]ORY61644.1 Sialidase [Pseudomassariella vexata]
MTSPEVQAGSPTDWMDLKTGCRTESLLHPTVSSTECPWDVSGAYPRLAWRTDGNIMGSYTSFSGSKKTLKVVESTDKGQTTFSPIGSIASSTGDLDNCFLLEVPLQPHSRRVPHTGKYTYYRLTLSISYDGGRSWKFLVNAVQSPPEADVLGFWEPFMRVGVEGEIQLSYSKTEATDNQETFRTKSFDGGHTWKVPQCLVCHAADEKKRDGMQSIVEVTDASTGQDALIVVYETTGHGLFSVQGAVTYDDGTSWGERQTVYNPAAGRNAGSPQIAQFSDGGLVVLFMTDEDASEVDWPNGATIKSVASSGLHNSAITVIDRVLVAEAESSWPGVLPLSGTEIMGVFGTNSALVGKPITQTRAA